MKKNSADLAEQYLIALRVHLDDGPESRLSAARELGERAVTLGMETLDLARMHEEALTSVVLPLDSERTREHLIQCGAAFFAEAIMGIESTHRGALVAEEHLKVMIKTLAQRTVALAVSNNELKIESVQRKSVEDSLRVSEKTTRDLLEQSRGLQEDLRLLSRRLLSAQEEERKRISRELHDVIAQTLTGINVQLATLKLQTNVGTNEWHKKIASTQSLVEKSVDIVQCFARDLRPTVLDDIGLIPALQSHMQSFMAQTGVRVSLTAFAGVEALSSEVRIVLYRVIQEALTNVARHSGASQAQVRLRAEADTVSVEIHDNGHGFDAEAAVVGKSRKRLGLLGMRERVEMIGGSFRIESAPGKETTVHLSISMPTSTPTPARP